MLLAHAVTLFLHRRSLQNDADLVQGLAQSLAHIASQLEKIEQIPAVMQDLNLGGVNLMPQKTLGETIMEHVMANFFGGKPKTKIIDGENTAEAWPDEKPSSEEPGDSQELTSQTPP